MYGGTFPTADNVKCKIKVLATFQTNEPLVQWFCAMKIISAQISLQKYLRPRLEAGAAALSSTILGARPHYHPPPTTTTTITDKYTVTNNSISFQNNSTVAILATRGELTRSFLKEMRYLALIICKIKTCFYCWTHNVIILTTEC